MHARQPAEKTSPAAHIPKEFTSVNKATAQKRDIHFKDLGSWRKMTLLSLTKTKSANIPLNQVSEVV